jgi:uncharacterized protein
MNADVRFIFPLNTVLFPGAALPLKIFEQRYLEMTKACIRENLPFGVCLIKEGRETGIPAVPQETGCLARITQWDMPQLGMFHLSTEGTQRFRIVRSSARKDGLISAEIETLPADPHVAPADEFCGEVLKSVIAKIGESYFPAPHDFTDAAWIGYRLCEVLPISLSAKQELLQIDDPQQRLSRLKEILSDKAVLG